MWCWNSLTPYTYHPSFFLFLCSSLSLSYFLSLSPLSLPLSLSFSLSLSLSLSPSPSRSLPLHYTRVGGRSSNESTQRRWCCSSWGRGRWRILDPVATQGLKMRILQITIFVFHSFIQNTSVIHHLKRFFIFLCLSLQFNSISITGFISSQVILFIFLYMLLIFFPFRRHDVNYNIIFYCHLTL